MKEVKWPPPKRGGVQSGWLSRIAIAFVLVILLIGYPPSGLQSAPAPRTKTSPPGTGAPSFATPRDLPSKGSPEAKLVLVVFTEFH